MCQKHEILSMTWKKQHATFYGVKVNRIQLDKNMRFSNYDVTKRSYERKLKFCLEFSLYISNDTLYMENF